MTTVISELVRSDDFVEFLYDASDASTLVLPDGDWQFILFASYTRDGDEYPRARAATTISGLIGLVASDYDGIADDGEAFLSRYYAAREIAGEVQVTFNAQAVGRGADLADPARAAVWAEKTEPVRVDVWEYEPPLVLVRSDYAPFAERPLVQGAVVWIDPTTERDFIESLDAAGFCQLAARGGDL